MEQQISVRWSLHIPLVDEAVFPWVGRRAAQIAIQRHTLLNVREDVDLHLL